MKKSIYDYQQYKRYLLDWIKSQPNRGRGMRSKFAEAIQSKSAFISQVLGGDQHFSLEQAIQINELLMHSKKEEKFFLLLVEYNRAGTPKLRKYFLEQINEALELRLKLKNRLENSRELKDEENSIYYSAWYYAAIHILLSIPEFRTKSHICERLRLPLDKVSDVLDFLCSAGLAIQEGDNYRMGKANVHLSKSDPLLYKHHSNWRLKSITSFDQQKIVDLHYSAAFAMKRKDAIKLKSILVDSIEKARNEIISFYEKDDSAEELFAHNLDFFQV